MLPKGSLILNTLTPNIKLAYADIKLVSETEYCQTFDATSRRDNQKYTIRTLNITSEFYRENSNLATTLFIQELLHLCTKFSDGVVIESFEAHEDGKLACAIRHCQSLQQLIDKDKLTAAKEIDCERLLKDVLLDINFLLTKTRISRTLSIELQSIYQMSGLKGYFLSDWAKNLEQISPEIATQTLADKMPDGANEVYNLGLKVLEINGIPKETIEDVVAIRVNKLYNTGIEDLLAELSEQPESLKESLRKILIRDPKNKSKPENQEENEKNEQQKHLLSKTLTLARFGKNEPTLNWGYFKAYDDGLTITASKPIQIEGIGLYVPTELNRMISGTVSLEMVSKDDGKTSALATVEICMAATSPGVIDKIYRVMFGTPVSLKAEVT